MKKLYFSLILALIACKQHALTDIPAKIPPFDIVNTNNHHFTPSNLSENKKVMLIYFSPDCNHCNELMQRLMPNIKLFYDTQIVMITWSNNYDTKAIKEFYHKYNLNRHPNITVGTEGYSYFVQNYLKVVSTPFIAMYDRNGKAAKVFKELMPIEALIQANKEIE